MRDRESHIQAGSPGGPATTSRRDGCAAALSDLDRLRAALETVALLVIEDPVYTPIFERLEAEIKIETAAQAGQSAAQARARALLGQRATGARTSLSIPSDPPSP